MACKKYHAMTVFSDTTWCFLESRSKRSSSGSPGSSSKLSEPPIQRYMQLYWMLLNLTPLRTQAWTSSLTKTERRITLCTRFWRLGYTNGIVLEPVSENHWPGVLILESFPRRSEHACQQQMTQLVRVLIKSSTS